LAECVTFARAIHCARDISSAFFALIGMLTVPSAFSSGHDHADFCDLRLRSEAQGAR
jgi:hypothetical protein